MTDSLVCGPESGRLRLSVLFWYVNKMAVSGTPHTTISQIPTRNFLAFSKSSGSTLTRTIFLSSSLSLQSDLLVFRSFRSWRPFARLQTSRTPRTTHNSGLHPLGSSLDSRLPSPGVLGVVPLGTCSSSSANFLRLLSVHTKRSQSPSIG